MVLILHTNFERRSTGISVQTVPTDKIDLDALIDLLETNDPGLVALNISFESIDPPVEPLSTAEELDAIGKAIAKSPNLRKLRLVAPRNPTILFLRLLEKVNENRSLQHLEMCNFEDGTMEDFQVLESFLGENRQLQSIHLICCNNLCSNIHKLVTPLLTRVNPLEEIFIHYGNLGDKGIKEMTSIFHTCPEMFPRKIYLMTIDISDEGCYRLSKIFGHEDVKLEEISLSFNQSITLRGFRAIMNSVVGKGTPLKVCDWSFCGIYCQNDFILAFSEIFASNPDMVPNEINFSGNLVSREALQSLGKLLVRRCSPLDELRLSYCPRASVEGILSLILTFQQNPDKTPKGLYLNSIWLDKHHGIEIAKLLSKRNCSLEALFVEFNSGVDREIIRDIMRSLGSNTRLREISLRNLDKEVLNYFATTALCDTTTIASTYSSNHTLVRFPYPPFPSPKIPLYLKLNNHPNKSIVGRIKVIEHHFVRNFDLRKFIHMDLSLLVQVISLICQGFVAREKEEFSTNIESIINYENKCGGKQGDIESSVLENNCLSIIFMMVKNIPSLIEGAER